VLELVQSDPLDDRPCQEVALDQVLGPALAADPGAIAAVRASDRVGHEVGDDPVIVT
jgi:hypothetical protein